MSGDTTAETVTERRLLMAAAARVMDAERTAESLERRLVMTTRVAVALAGDRPLLRLLGSLEWSARAWLVLVFVVGAVIGLVSGSVLGAFGRQVIYALVEGWL